MDLAELQRRADAAKERAANKKPKESAIEKDACEYAESLGVWQAKFKSQNNRGVPDRIFIAPGNIAFFIEFKAPGKKARWLQSEVAKDMMKNGAHVIFCDNLEEAKRVIDRMVETALWA